MEKTIRKNRNVEMTQSQAARVEALLADLTKDPAMEVKDVALYQPLPEEGQPRAVARMVLVQAEVGYPDDGKDWRKLLRARRTFLVSPRGRVEEWDHRRAFHHAA